MMSKKRSRRRSGQTLVEAAFVLGLIILPLTMGMIQFALVSNAATTLQQIAREGGRFAAVHGLDTTYDSGVTQGDTSGQTPSLKNYLNDVCAPTSIKYSDITPTTNPSALASRAAGQAISVTIAYPMVKKVFLGNMFPGTGIMSTLKKNYYVTSTFVLE